MVTNNPYKPAGRLPIGQYRVTALITGDAIGPETLSWLIADRINNMAGGALTGRIELIETLGHDSSDGWSAALERRVGPTTSYAEARTADQERDAVQNMTGIGSDAYPNPACGQHTGNGSNRCLLAPSHPGDHNDDPPQEGREKGIVQSILNDVIRGIEGLHDSRSPHDFLNSRVATSDALTVINRVADRYSVIP